MDKFLIFHMIVRAAELEKKKQDFKNMFGLVDSDIEFKLNEFILRHLLFVTFFGVVIRFQCKTLSEPTGYVDNLHSIVKSTHMEYVNK